MIYSEDVALKVAEFLLQIKAIKLQPTKPFTWSSGWKSPIYCDNRVTLSFPIIRNYIRQTFAEIIKDQFQDSGMIAGVATGGIAHGVLTAQDLGLPFLYVRSESKKHGMGNQIEGQIVSTKNIVVVEDLVSTGKSSLQAVDALRAAECEVKNMVAIFNYGFAETDVLFKTQKVNLITLSDYDHLIKKALEMEYIKEDQLDTLREWRQNPSLWMQS